MYNRGILPTTHYSSRRETAGRSQPPSSLRVHASACSCTCRALAKKRILRTQADKRSPTCGKRPRYYPPPIHIWAYHFSARKKMARWWGQSGGKPAVHAPSPWFGVVCTPQRARRLSSSQLRHSTPPWPPASTPHFRFFQKKVSANAHLLSRRCQDSSPAQQTPPPTKKPPQPRPRPVT